MIRVNLLRPRTQAGGDLQSALPRGRSTFISRREVLVVVILLVAGASMLHLHYGLSEPEQAGEGKDAAAASPPAADSSDTASNGSDLESNAPSADSASANGSEDATSGGAGQESPFTRATDGSSATLAASPTPEQQAMAKTRRDAALRAAPKPRQPTTLPPPGAAKLREVAITQRGGALRLSLITAERSTYSMFRLENPNRVVVDVPGTWITLPFARRSQEISHPLVHRIRLGQYKVDPPVSRLVLDVEGFPNLLIFPHSSGLDIQVSNTTE